MRASRDISRILPRKRELGMSLAELLVAAAILIILVLMLGQMLTQASAGWSRGEAHKDQLQTARAVMTALKTDLQSALVPINRSNTASLQFFINGSAGTAPFAVPAEYRNRDAVFFQAPAVSGSASDVAEIGYFVKWDNSNPANPRSLMCRFFATSSDPEYRITSDPAQWLTPEIIAKLTPAIVDNSNPALSYRGLLAENILGFWIRPLDPLGEPIEQGGTPGSYDSRVGYSYGKDPNVVVRPACVLPTAVDVGIVMVAPEFARRIGAAEQNAIRSQISDAASAAEFEGQLLASPALKKIRAGVRSFETTILLKNGQ